MHKNRIAPLPFSRNLIGHCTLLAKAEGTFTTRGCLYSRAAEKAGILRNSASGDADSRKPAQPRSYWPRSHRSVPPCIGPATSGARLPVGGRGAPVQGGLGE